MRGKLIDAAFAACLVLSSAMVALTAARGVGVQVSEALDFWTLETMHLAFLLAFVPALWGALRDRRALLCVLYALPLVGFLVSLGAAVAGTALPPMVNIGFEVYLLLVSTLYLAGLRVPGVPGEAEYQEVPSAEAYQLLNTGGVVLVCTSGPQGRYNLAPIAWCCPLDLEPNSRVLMVMDPEHQTVKNLEASGAFALALPTFRQRELVDKTGAVSGRDRDKYADFHIGALPAREIDTLIPTGVAGHLECRVLETRRIGSVLVIAGEVVYARAVPEAWRHRLHYVGGKRYYRPRS